jgi:hypothetical protein
VNGRLEQFVPLTFQRHGVQWVAIGDRPTHDVPLLEALGRALYWQQFLDAGCYGSIAELAAAEGLHKTTVRVVVKLSLLAPDLVALILAGRQPPSLTLHWLQRHTIPVQWPAQRELFTRFRENGVGE